MSSPFVLEVFKFEPVEGCIVVSCNESYHGDVDEFVLFIVCGECG